MNFLFEAGKLMLTPGAFNLLEQQDANWFQLLLRHRRGDFGDLSAEDKQANEQAIVTGSRIFSSYVVGTKGEKVWVITEATDDLGIRRSTCILTPSEY